VVEYNQQDSDCAKAIDIGTVGKGRLTL